jgi:hypothetical protein
MSETTKPVTGEGNAPRISGQHSYTPNEFGLLVESLIDKHTLKDLLEAIGNIALEKSYHIKENWQDEVTAKTWESASKAVFKAYAKVTALGV